MGIVAAGAVATGPAPAQPPGSGAEGGDPVLVDRVVAVVDEDPILMSDLERVIALGLVAEKDDESPEELRRRVLDGLIEEKLRFHELDRFGFVEVPLDEVEAQYQRIRSGFASEQAFADQLAAVGLDEQGLRQLVARQIMVLIFVQERLGPRVFVDLDSIQAYYDDELVPELRRRGAEVPPVDAVREKIRAVLRERLLDEEIESWTDELRGEADIEDFFDEVIGPTAGPGG